MSRFTSQDDLVGKLGVSQAFATDRVKTGSHNLGLTTSTVNLDDTGREAAGKFDRILPKDRLSNLDYR